VRPVRRAFPGADRGSRRRRPVGRADGAGTVRCGVSELEAEAAGRAGLLPLGAHATQALDEHRVGGQRLRAVDELVEDLVVAGRAHVEQVLDGLLLGTGVLPPLALELEDAAVAVAELGRVGLAVTYDARSTHATSLLRDLVRGHSRARNHKRDITRPGVARAGHGTGGPLLPGRAGVIQCSGDHHAGVAPGAGPPELGGGARPR